MAPIPAQACAVYIALAVSLYVIAGKTTAATSDAKLKFALGGGLLGAVAYLIPSLISIWALSFLGFAAMLLFLGLFYVAIGWWANTALDLDYRETEGIMTAVMVTTAVIWLLVKVITLPRL